MNILEIDTHIKQVLAFNKPLKRELKPECYYTNWFVKYLSSQNSVEITYEFYLLEVLELISLYERELRKPVSINFYKPKTSPSTSPLQSALDSYIRIVSSLGIVAKISGMCSASKPKPVSFKCSCTESQCTIEDNNFHVCCKYCGERSDLNNIAINYDDVKRLIILQKNPHDKKHHFADCIDKFQGIQKTDFPENLEQSIEAELKKYGLLTDSNDKLKRFSKVKKDHIKLILKSLGLFTKLKEDINVIYKLTTGKPLPRINHLKSRLLEDFGIFDTCYNKLFIESEKKRVPLLPNFI